MRMKDDLERPNKEDTKGKIQIRLNETLKIKHIII